MARNNKTTCYKKLHLSRCNESLSTGVAFIFMQGGCNSYTMDFYYKPWTVITETAICQLSVWSN